jgi:RNA polymerase sigma factor (sigma-70 family)
MVATQLVRTLRRSYGFSDTEAQDVAQDVIVSLLETAKRGSLAEIRNPGAYVIRLARNRAIDALRLRHRGDVELSVELTKALIGHDDAIAALLDKSADADRVRTAMSIAQHADDELARRVVATWLDVADEIGDSPSNRDVAKRAGISHTSVNNALKRFREYLLDASRTPP